MAPRVCEVPRQKVRCRRVYEISPDRRINRYYDPATDQFLSIDPAVDQSGLPYVYVNDNPLNRTDPLGNLATAIMAGGAGVTTGEETRSLLVLAIQESETVLRGSMNILEWASSGAQAIANQLNKLTSTPNAFSNVTAIESAANGLAKFSSASSLLGSFALGITDITNGHGPGYAYTNIGFSLGGAALGYYICGGPADPAAVICGVLGGLIGDRLFKSVFG